MLKKFFATIFATLLILVGFVGLAEAKTGANSELTKYYQDQFTNDHYDYAKGSFKLTSLQQINLDTPIEVNQGGKKVKVTHVIAGYATFKTVRDHIYFKDWKEAVFYAPDQSLALTTGDTLNVKALQQYKNQHPSGVSMELWAIGTLLFLLIIIPLLFVFVWSKYQYSTLGFKIKNKLYFGTTTDQSFN